MSRPYSYAQVADVSARLPWFSIATSSKPNATQVTGYLADASNEIDSRLGQQFYVVPVPTTAAVASDQLRTWATVGAAVRTIEGMPQGQDSPHLSSLVMEWQAILDNLDSGDANLADAPKNPATAIRSGPPGDPRFSSDPKFR